MKVLTQLQADRPKIKVVVFDFDGTISTLRHGWETIMEPMMLEMISGESNINDKLVAQVNEYIDQSTGIQTIFQMQWLAETVKKYGNNPDASDDPWWYKAEYNRRLMVPVEERKKQIADGDKSITDFLIKGSGEFLSKLQQYGIKCYVASGTDHSDVVKEVKVLGMSGYFEEIAGAPEGQADCSKEAVLRKLIYDHKLSGQEVMVAGDGKVEIALGREMGAITLGVASDEEKLEGLSLGKMKRLEKAGAHAIVGDFSDLEGILSWMGLQD